jgi:hypothetical protein
LSTDAEPVCVAVAQVLSRGDEECRRLRVAPTPIGHLFPHLPCQSEYNRHLRALGAGHVRDHVGAGACGSDLA